MIIFIWLGIVVNQLNLEIDGFGLINNAKIKINKINVVGGVNASGKSTASKLLYCFLKSMSLNRKDYILSVILPVINTYIKYMNNLDPCLSIDENIPDKFTLEDNFEDILSGYFDAKVIHEKIGDDYFVVPSEILEDMESKIETYCCILINKEEYGFDISGLKIKNPEKLYLDTGKAFSSILKSLFQNESLLNFEGKSTFYNDSFKSQVSYERIDSELENFGPERIDDLKARKLSFDDFDDNFIYFTKGTFNFLNDVFYIDSISTLDLDYYIESKKRNNDVFGYKEHIEYLLKQLKSTADKSNLSKDSIIKMEAVKEKIKNIIGGSIHREPKFIFQDIPFDEGYYFHPNDSDNHYNVNISSGIQQFSIVQILLDNYKLVPRSFLIIDEPEVNLHPEWQFKFAEILVLLAKELDITIYINSHSPMFIEAIDAFTEYYDISDDINYYLTEFDGIDKYNFKKIESDELYKIYNNLGNAYDLIDQLRLKKHLGE